VPRLITAATLTFLATGVVAASADAASEPILAGPWSSNQEGYGQVKPRRIFNGGDPTGLVTDIHWLTWGRSQAIGTGMAEWVGPHQDVAGGRPQPARIVLFRLGSCRGRRAYDAIEWYFPQHGQYFDAHQYINACTGIYYPRA
jgi:hypothetical protein